MFFVSATVLFDTTAHQHDCDHTLLLEVVDDDVAEDVDDIVVEQVACIHESEDPGSWMDTEHEARVLACCHVAS